MSVMQIFQNLDVKTGLSMPAHYILVYSHARSKLTGHSSTVSKGLALPKMVAGAVL